MLPFFQKLGGKKGRAANHDGRRKQGGQPAHGSPPASVEDGQITVAKTANRGGSLDFFSTKWADTQFHDPTL